MNNKLIGLTIGAAVAIIVLASVLAPITDSYSSEYVTYTNEGVPFDTVDDGTHVIEITNSDGVKITVDDKAVDMAPFLTLGDSSVSILLFDDAFARVVVSTAQFRVMTAEYVDTLTMTSSSDIVITLNGDTATITGLTNTRTISGCTHYVSTQGDFVMAKNPIVLESSEILGAGQTYFSAWNSNIFLAWSGSGDDISSNVFRQNGFDDVPELTNVTVNKTDVGNSAYRIDSVVFKYAAAVSGASVTPSAAYTYFLAPAEVQAPNENYIGAGAALIGVLPMLVIIAVLVGVVSVAVRGTRD